MSRVCKEKLISPFKHTAERNAETVKHTLKQRLIQTQSAVHMFVSLLVSE